MAAGATGATAGKGSVASATRNSALAVDAERTARLPQPHEQAGTSKRATAEATAGDDQAAAASAGAQARASGAKQRAGAGAGAARGAARPAGFAQTLERLRPAHAAAAVAKAGEAAQASSPAAVHADMQDEAAAASNDTAVAQEDPEDGALAGDAASAVLEAVLQWLRPVTPASGGDAQGESSPQQGQEQPVEGGIAGIPSAGSPASVATAMAGAAAGMAQVATIMGEEAADAGLPATGAASVEPSVGAIAARAPGATDAATASVQQGLEALAKAIRNVVALDGAGAGGDRAGRQPKDQGADAAASAPAVAVPGASAVAGQAADASGAAAVAATLRQAGAATVERTVPVPVHDRHWAQAMAGQVLVLADQRIDSATLRLSPAHLGSVEVHIEMQAQGVNVSFGAEHAETRAALEQALPQLRAAFAGAGLTLGEATVQQQMRQGSQNTQATAQDRGAAADHLEVTPSVIRAIGLVDEYA